jgi:hypothetical protein
MVKIEVRCPVCSEWKKIEVADDATENVSKGLLAINIAPGMICEHTFIAYIDKNFTVRDCLVADFEIQIQPSTEGNQEIVTPETETIKFDLIKLNIPEMLLVHLLKSTLLGKKVLIILDQEFLFNHIKNFFKNIFEGTFDFDIEIVMEMTYKNNEDKYKDYLVFKNREIIRDEKDIINPKELEIEKEIVQKFFNEYDLMAGLILLRNEIKKAYAYSKSIVDLLETSEGKSLTSKKIIQYLSIKHADKIQMPYLKYLFEIVQNYFNVVIPRIDGVSNLLGLL